MKHVMQCRDLREIADSYLSDELTIETNHEVIRHLESCADCRRELAARRNLRAQLRAAILHAPDLQMRDEFAERLRRQLRAAATRRTIFDKRSTWLTIAACVLVAVLLGVIVIRQRQARERETSLAQSSNANSENEDDAVKSKNVRPSLPASAGAAVNLAASEVLDNAAGDHRNCAVQFRLKQKPVPMAVAGRRYDNAYLHLANAALAGRGDFVGELQFVKAHACVYQGRRFGHVILKYRGQLVSLLVTDLAPSPQPASAAKNNLQPSAIVAACPETRGYNVACFETARHAVFVVSTLSETTNLEIARSLATPVRAHVERAESVA